MKNFFKTIGTFFKKSKTPKDNEQIKEDSEIQNPFSKKQRKSRKSISSDSDGDLFEKEIIHEVKEEQKEERYIMDYRQERKNKLDDQDSDNNEELNLKPLNQNPLNFNNLNFQKGKPIQIESLDTYENQQGIKKKQQQIARLQEELLQCQRNKFKGGYQHQQKDSRQAVDKQEVIKKKQQQIARLQEELQQQDKQNIQELQQIDPRQLIQIKPQKQNQHLKNKYEKSLFEDENIKEIQCSHCKKFFTNNSKKLNQHQKSCKDKERLCYNCLEQVDKSKYQQHKKDCNDLENDYEQTVACDKCLFFISKRNWEEHKKSCGVKKNKQDQGLQCDNCQEYVSKRNWQQHRQQCFQKKNEFCKVCSKSIAKSRIKTHMELHSNTLPQYMQQKELQVSSGTFSDVSGEEYNDAEEVKIDLFDYYKPKKVKPIKIKPIEVKPLRNFISVKKVAPKNKSKQGRFLCQQFIDQVKVKVKGIN